MRQKNKKKLKRVLIRITLIELLAALYVSGMLNTLYSSNGVSFSPLAIILSYGECGFPIGPFIIIFLIFAVVTAFVFLHVWGKDDGADPLGRKFTNAVDRQVYGDAHFETPEEYGDMAVIQSPQKSFGTILGQLDQSGKYLINLRHDDARINHHIMVVGASGSGKTYTFAKDYCLQTIRRRESIIITDPDGGLTRDMATSFWNAGYMVRVLNLKNLTLSDGWDCLKTVRSGMVETTAHLFAHIVISNIMDSKTQSIYKDGPESLLTALILRCLLGSDVREEDKNIGTVYNYLLQPNAAEFLDRLFDETQIPLDAKPCLGPYQAAKSASANLWGNLVTNLAIGLNLLQSAEVRELLTTDDISLTMPGERPCAYFCQFPDSHDTFRFVVALFFSMLFINLIDLADRQDDGKLPVPVNFLMDECASIGIIPDFDRKMATIRKRDMAVAMIWQNVSQIQNNYYSTWETIMSNCDTFLSLGINDSQTADMVTKRIGDTTVTVQTQQHEGRSSFMAAVNRYSTGEGRRALLSYDELFKVERDHCIIIFKGHNPIHAYKHPHILHPDSRNMSKWYIRDKTPITEYEQRRKERMAEQIELATYENAHPFNDIDRSYTGKFGASYSGYDDTENGASGGKKWPDIWISICTKAATLKESIGEQLENLRPGTKSEKRARRIRRNRRIMGGVEPDWWPDERNQQGSSFEPWETQSVKEDDIPEVELMEIEQEADGIEWETPPPPAPVPEATSLSVPESKKETDTPESISHRSASFDGFEESVPHRIVQRDENPALQQLVNSTKKPVRKKGQSPPSKTHR